MIKMTENQQIALQTILENPPYKPIIFGINYEEQNQFARMNGIGRGNIPYKVEHLDPLLNDISSYGCVIELPYWRDDKSVEFLTKAQKIINHFSPVGFKRIRNHFHSDGFIETGCGVPFEHYWIEVHGENIFSMRPDGKTNGLNDSYAMETVQDFLKDGTWVEF